MKSYYYNLSGGINLASTKTELGLDTTKLFWSDSKNVELLKNRGIITQKGNAKLFSLPEAQEISAICDFSYSKAKNILILTKCGDLYVYNSLDKSLQSLDINVPHNKVGFVKYLDGVIICSDISKMIFVRNNGIFTVKDCNLKDSNGDYIFTDVAAVYKGRVWAVKDACIYFSALGKVDDFETAEDAGYINNFHTDADEVTALKPYKDYLAIYKEHRVYLLTGDNPSNFAIIPFADKGTCSNKTVLNVNNKQYFLTDGIYPLEVGMLNQIVVGADITSHIKSEFEMFETSRLGESFALNYEAKSQIWYFIPYKNSKYFNTIWINDYANKAWYKRVVPQNIVSACIFEGVVLTADNLGNVYQEDIGNSFDGKPIDFLWKSPFLSIGNPSVRKSIDEFYFILDENYENNFKFSVYKNFDSETKDDIEEIYSTNFESLHWATDERVLNDRWSDDDNNALWSVGSDTLYKAEISEANYSVQLCVEGSDLVSSAAIIGIEFKEVYVED